MARNTKVGKAQASFLSSPAPKGSTYKAPKKSVASAPADAATVKSAASRQRASNKAGKAAAAFNSAPRLPDNGNKLNRPSSTKAPATVTRKPVKPASFTPEVRATDIHPFRTPTRAPAPHAEGGGKAGLITLGVAGLATAAAYMGAKRDKPETGAQAQARVDRLGQLDAVLQKAKRQRAKK